MKIREIWFKIKIEDPLPLTIGNIFISVEIFEKSTLIEVRFRFKNQWNLFQLVYREKSING